MTKDYSDLHDHRAAFRRVIAERPEVAVWTIGNTTITFRCRRDPQYARDCRRGRKRAA